MVAGPLAERAVDEPVTGLVVAQEDRGKWLVDRRADQIARDARIRPAVSRQALGRIRAPKPPLQTPKALSGGLLTLPPPFPIS